MSFHFEIVRRALSRAVYDIPVLFSFDVVQPNTPFIYVKVNSGLYAVDVKTDPQYNGRAVKRVFLGYDIEATLHIEGTGNDIKEKMAKYSRKFALETIAPIIEPFNDSAITHPDKVQILPQTTAIEIEVLRVPESIKDAGGKVSFLYETQQAGAEISLLMFRTDGVLVATAAGIPGESVPIISDFEAESDITNRLDSW